MLDFYSIWPSFVCVAALLAVVSSPIFAFLDRPLAANPRLPRIDSIDGLRGFLALAVVLHHIAIVHHVFGLQLLGQQGWTYPPSRFYSLAGPVGVSMFFMITGYLFWSRLLNSGDRMDWLSLYIGRIFRIGPLYIAAVGAAWIVDLWSRLAHDSDQLVRSFTVSKQVSSIALLGLSVYPDVNKVLAGVTWSIQYEWLFYLSLPCLAILLCLRKLQTVFVAGLLSACLVARGAQHSIPVGQRTHYMLAALFLVGMLCACVRREQRKVLPNWLSSLMTIVLIGLVFFFKDAYTPMPLILLGGAFYLVVSGCTVFGLLESRPAIRLGDVSYGVYLLQGLVLSAVFRPETCRAFALGSPWRHWCLSAVALFILFMLATLTFVLIERPGIDVGRRITRKWRLRHQAADCRDARTT